MLVYILIAAACLLVGFFVGRILTSRSYLAEQNRLKQELLDLEASFGAYRQEVAGHFVQSADLFNQLTQSYKAVVDHMAQGADQLVAEDVLQKRLGDSQQEAVVLNPIGQVKRLAAQAGLSATGAYLAAESSEQVTAEELLSTSAHDESSHGVAQPDATEAAGMTVDSTEAVGSTEVVDETETVQTAAEQSTSQHEATAQPEQVSDLDQATDSDQSVAPDLQVDLDLFDEEQDGAVASEDDQDTVAKAA